MAATLHQRRKDWALTGAAGAALVAAILILGNVLANWVFVRWDLTQSHAYSLSKPSRRLVRQLDDPVVIKAYFTPDLPSPYNAYSRYVSDMLSEYRSASHGKVRFEFVPAEPAKDFEQKASEAGLAPLEFQEMSNDQFQVRRGYMGLVLFYRDKSEILPVVKNIEGLEFDLTSRIARMAVKNKKVIAWTSGHGETPLDGGPQSKLPKDLSDLYDFKDVALSASTTAPIQADALLIVGPRQKFDDHSLWAVDQAIMRGIPAAFLLDAKGLMVNQFIVTPQDAGLNELLKTYGAQRGGQLVYDAQCATVGLTQNVAGFSLTTSVHFPYIPLVSGLDAGQPLLQGLDTVGLPFSVTVNPQVPSASHAQFTPLFSSSAKSWLAPEQTYSVAPNSIPQPRPSDPHGPYTLGGLLEGTFTSYFQGKTPPVAGQPLIAASPKNQIFILGTSRILDSNLPPFPGDEALVSNLLAYLAHDDVLLGIRSKGDILRPLKPITSAPVRELVKIFSILGVPFLAVLWGLARWRRRQAWRRQIALGFAPGAAANAPPPAP